MLDSQLLSWVEVRRKRFEIDSEAVLRDQVILELHAMDFEMPGVTIRDGDEEDGGEFSEEDFDACFKEFDKDNSGTIEKDEMAIFIKKVAGL